MLSGILGKAFRFVETAAGVSDEGGAAALQLSALFNNPLGFVKLFRHGMCSDNCGNQSKRKLLRTSHAYIARLHLG